MGQSSYSQEGWDNEEEWYENESWDSNDNDYTNNWQDFLSEWFGLDIAGITDGGNFLLSNGDYFYPDSSNLDEVNVNSYHVSEQYEYVPIGENNGNPGGDESEETVDDPTDNCSISYCMPGYTLQNCECVKVSCTKTCESGYKLNIDTCECELLPPCWGTIQDFETSNSFNTNTILNKLNSTLGDFGISADVMDSIKQMNLFDPKTIATGTDLVTFADDLGVVGDGLQVALDYSKYIDEPSTQNLLRTVLDAASMALSPAASLALSTIDYFKDGDGNSKLDLLLKAASDAIDRSLDCNLGLGIRNWVY
ncbi:hypothetical protein [Flavobacterium cellulosilyticum]|uniref:Uncharacterized protein n=1 Tax=Flavobacterium cellulosilyticum TaxID=2541731 RepID=A0A4R5CJ02_9FLAO|nr:hypothetical protein [Flavobacterium cellulosilyticum]TDD98560.1 hypothetical protein E0F76_05375 [Flavobacterium cellulosilyticum]